MLSYPGVTTEPFSNSFGLLEALSNPQQLLGGVPFGGMAL